MNKGCDVLVSRKARVRWVSLPTGHKGELFPCGTRLKEEIPVLRLQTHGQENAKLNLLPIPGPSAPPAL